MFTSPVFCLSSLPGREDNIIYDTAKLPAASMVYSPVLYPELCSLSSDPTPLVSAAGKVSSNRQPALVLLVLCCLLLAAIISLAVYHFRTEEDPEKYTSLTTNYSSLLNQLQHNNRLNETHSELQKKWMQFNGKCYYFSTDTMDWNSSHDNCKSMGGHLVIIESKAEQVQFDHHLYRALFLKLMKHQAAFKKLLFSQLLKPLVD
ncbi:hepatic lectin-like [Acipenser oxyrinchus oxyrinchus]|uniref:Hepatic lectin-like n=1 Tax=Acipenser oxyrinchus oxyrinchus TaxID=40147 RepID=A0AAD8CE94_ACIOX|nr:hepatic lectin-like [Acipenser oxyrinchus oxyrinchus]